MIWSFLLIEGSLFYYSPLSKAIVAAPLVKWCSVGKHFLEMVLADFL